MVEKANYEYTFLSEGLVGDQCIACNSLVTCFSRTSVAYSTASKTKGTRLMLINEVALGNCFDTTEKDLTLTCAPEGYQSVHGVKATDTQSSDFKVGGMSSQLTITMPICFFPENVVYFLPLLQIFNGLSLLSLIIVLPQ